MTYYPTEVPGFQIRTTTEADAKIIMDFIKELAVYEKMLDEVIATEELLREWIYEQKKCEVLIGELEGVPVGYALFFHNFSTFLGRAGIYLEDIYVQPQYRGKGLGKALLRHLAKTAVERKCGRMEWSCLNWNAPSIAFYKSLGAQPMDEWTVYRLTGDNLNALASGDTIDQH